VFYVHFDRAELKKMGRMKKDEPPGEIVDEDILVHGREMKNRLFQNKLGVDLRRGGSIIEEEKDSVSGFQSSRRFIENDSRLIMSHNNLKEAIEASSVRSKITTASHRNALSTRDSDHRMGLLNNKKVNNMNADRKENEPTNRRQRETATRQKSMKDDSLETSNQPKKHKYYSHFRKMKALNLTEFQQNKDVLCTLESDDNSEFAEEEENYVGLSIDNSSIMNDQSFPKRTFSNLQEDHSELKNTRPMFSTEANSILQRKSSYQQPAARVSKDLVPIVTHSPIIVNKATLPPYRHPKQLHPNHAYFSNNHHLPTGVSRRLSRDNSTHSIHTRRSSVSVMEKTNVSGWSFMLAAPALSIYRLIGKEAKDAKNTEQDLIKKRENGTFVTDSESFVDLTPFKFEPKYTKTIVNIAIQLFNHNTVKGLSFMFLFKILRQNLKEIALFLHKNENADLVKKNQYQITQLLSNSHLKETLDILHNYASFFQFQGMPFLEALRVYLNSFVLENDPDKIDWILRGFTKKYYSTLKKAEKNRAGLKSNLSSHAQKEAFETPEAVHMLAFATVMLDIELNHTENRDSSFDSGQREATIKAEFEMSLAYVNGGDNFDKSLLDELFTGVKRKSMIKMVGPQHTSQIEETTRFRLESAKLVVGAKRASKVQKGVNKDYWLFFDGPLCFIGKIVGRVTMLRAIFVVKGCRMIRGNNKKIKFKRISSDEKDEIPFVKYGESGDLGVTSRKEIMFVIENPEDAIKVQKYLDSVNM